jgi:hypothetical protein
MLFQTETWENFENTGQKYWKGNGVWLAWIPLDRYFREMFSNISHILVWNNVLRIAPIGLNGTSPNTPLWPRILWNFPKNWQFSRSQIVPSHLSRAVPSQNFRILVEISGNFKFCTKSLGQQTHPCFNLVETLSSEVCKGLFFFFFLYP